MTERITFRVLPQVELLEDGRYYPEAVVTAYQGPDPINEVTLYANHTTRWRSDAIALANELVSEIRETICTR
ncbi:MAG: hypothetical protein ACREYA_34965 [Cupriavidus necator]